MIRVPSCLLPEYTDCGIVQIKETASLLQGSVKTIIIWISSKFCFQALQAKDLIVLSTILSPTPIYFASKIIIS